MNSAASWLAALQPLLPLALEIGIVAGVASLVQRFVHSALWRRIVWQISLIGALVLAICEVSGVVGTARYWFAPNTSIADVQSEPDRLPIPAAVPNEPAETIELNLAFYSAVSAKVASLPASELESSPLTEEDRGTSISNSAIAPIPPASRLETAGEPQTNSAVSDVAETSAPDFPPESWMAFGWLAGACAIAIRLIFCGAMFHVFRRRFQPYENSSLRSRVLALAKKVGVSRSIRLVESSRLAGPVAYGLFNPTIALPSNFLRDFNPAQQEAMLAHELAHLAAGDSAWQWLSECVVAVLWWHPLVWWMKRQLHTASEAAADEASLIVANGPSALAECLVALGGRLLQPRSRGWAGIEGNGFRSGLARRVNRLIKLQGNTWNQPNLLWSRLTKCVGPLGLAAFAIAGTAWVDAPENKGESMNTIHKSLRQSLSTLALVSAIASETSAPSPLASDEPPAASASLVSIPDGTTSGPNLAAASASQQTLDAPGTIDQALRKRYGIEPPPVVRTPPSWDRDAIRNSSSSEKVRSKLVQTILAEVFYDGTPLPEVLENLSNESVKRDPDKLGLNFLISNAASNNRNQNPYVRDLLDISSPNAVLDIHKVLIRLNSPLRHLRMKDVLDVIVAVADHPIHYSIENYGVVFSPGVGTQDNSKDEEEQNSMFRMDPALMQRYGLLARHASNDALSQIAKGRIDAKLDQIILGEVFYDAVPFSEVVKDLDDRVRSQDPEKEGLNFIFNPSSKIVPAPTALIDARTGQPVVMASSNPVDLSSVMVRFNLPLRNVRLRDALDAIVRVAEKPIQYSVANFGVIFSIRSSGDPRTQSAATRLNPTQNTFTPGSLVRPASASPAALEVRTFRVDTDTFARGLENALGIKSGSPPIATNPIEIQKKRILLELAEKELSEIQKKFEVGAAGPSELERARAGVELLRAPNELERARIRLRLAEHEVGLLQKQFENGKASSIDLARAQADVEVMKLEFNEFENGRSPAALKDDSTQQGSTQSEGAGTGTSNRRIAQWLTKLLAELGVSGLNPEIGEEGGVAGTPLNSDVSISPFRESGKIVFYNSLTGIVLVRAATEDMKTIEAVMETLGGFRQNESEAPQSIESPRNLDRRLSPQNISILGAVQKPGVFEILPNTRMDLVEGIARAGGFAAKANKNKVELTHKGEVNTYKFDDLRKAQDLDKKIWLEPGDLIYVPESNF